MKHLKLKSKHWSKGILSLGLSFVFLFSMVYKDLHVQLSHGNEELVCRDHERSSHFHQGAHSTEDCPICHAFVPSQVIYFPIEAISLSIPAELPEYDFYAGLQSYSSLPNPSNRGPPAIS
ncbi:MAG: hypothetical protein ABIV51_00760 [Saprospiraceae bacterium]